MQGTLHQMHGTLQQESCINFPVLENLLASAAIGNNQLPFEHLRAGLRFLRRLRVQ
jgi:hypothetical protein